MNVNDNQINEKTSTVKRTVFNSQTLLNQLSGNINLYKKILENFSNSMKKQVKNIELMVENKDAKETVAAGHKLKGAAASVGCNQLSDLAANIEEAGNENNIDEAQKLQTQLQPCYELTKKAIEEMLSEI